MFFRFVVLAIKLIVTELGNFWKAKNIIILMN